MKIAIIGASGFIGSGLLDEAQSRGHEVTALVRHPDKVSDRVGVSPVAVNVLDQAALASSLRDHDAVISAFSGHAQDDVYDHYVQGIQSIIAAAKHADVPRLLVVGGAGSLQTDDGVELLDTPAFPEMYKATAEGARTALRLLREEPTLNWTMLSPSAEIFPGERTGEFRLADDRLIVDDAGRSSISVADYAVAMLDEVERPAYPKRRFTVGY
ncbi:NAD(P)-dependent oxidoreductase [Arhodomonas sp. AD133]|uniref:NAD(P)-dependent oxidoreductase n=1 Tax=Arhodomonas sp. AD133 TaxID=3415009 RepID=UPI003EBE1145